MQYHPTFHARTNPDRPAVIMGGSGRTITYRELDEASNRAAQLFRSRGLKIGDTIAICLENHPDFFSVAWGAQRAGWSMSRSPAASPRRRSPISPRTAGRSC
jgi:fatty-acyl-CoA synthase